MQSVLMVLRDDEVIEYECQLSDLSEGGCAVRASLGEDTGVAVAVLHVSAPNFDIELEVAGRLCWNQQTSVGKETFGLRFRRPLDPNLIDQMVDHGLVTRRQEARLPAGISIQIRRSHGKPEVSDVRLEDVSASGLRLTTTGDLEVSERMLVTMPSGDSGTVKVVWVGQSQGRTECGCVFQNLRSAQAIGDAMNCVAY